MAQFGIVNADRLNLRESASTNARIVQVLTRDMVLVIVRDAGFGWLEVQVDGSSQRGFVSKVYLRFADARPGVPTPTPAPAPVPTPVPAPVPITSQQGEVTVATLNVRSGDGTQNPILFTLKQGALVDILEKKGDWLRINANGPNGQSGFVAAQYIRAVSGVMPPPAPLSGFLIDRPELSSVVLVPDLQIPAQADNTDQGLIAGVWNRFGGLIDTLAGLLNIPVGSVIATLAAESGGRVFGPDGRIIIRFEVHVFWRYWGSANVDAFNKFFTFDRSTPSNSWKGHQWRSDETQPLQNVHVDQNREWQAFSFARTLNDEAALMSISMGAAQVMGFNFKRLGYPTVQAMFQRFTSGAHAQLIGIFDFVKGPAATSAAIQALQRNDFLAFATIYNGAGNAPTYAGIIQRYVNAFNQLIGTARKPGAF